MREVQWTEVDGVPTVWADVGGPLRVSLGFRCGIANETMPRRGITHLVEHLALFGMHDRPYRLNGAVDLTRTSFYATGDDDEMTEFLASVCTALGALPSDRVEVERNILRAEADGRGTTYRDTLLYWRYGAQAHGLAPVEELGLRWLDATAVQWWAGQRFTRQNAVLVLSGPPPAGLWLPLADGDAHPAVEPEVVEPIVPGWATANGCGVAMSAVVPSSPAAGLACRFVDEELGRVLRFERGITYTVGGAYERITAGSSHAVFSVESEQSRHAELTEAFVEVLERVAAEGPSQEYLDRSLAQVERALRDEEEEFVVGHMDRQAAQYLLGGPRRSVADVLAETHRVTRDDVATALRAIEESALYLLPPHGELPESRYRMMTTGSFSAVHGDWYRSTVDDEQLVVGAEGISRVDGDRIATVRWAEAVGGMWWNDGSRSVLGKDGFRVLVVPADWQNGADAVRRIDASMPPGLMVAMGDGGPKPKPWRGPPPKAPRKPGAAAWAGVLAAFVLGLLFVAVGVSGPEPATATREEFTRSDANFSIGLGVVVLLCAAGGAVALRKRSGQAERRSVPS